MPPRKRRSYSTEYKVEAAHRVIDSGRTIADVARELGIDAGMLSVWVKDERRRVEAATSHGDQPLSASERAELQALRRQSFRAGQGHCVPEKRCATNTGGCVR
ncbi:transposase [Nocardia sp. NPDC059236]